jgi:hypothetical protein
MLHWIRDRLVDFSFELYVHDEIKRERELRLNIQIELLSRTLAPAFIQFAAPVPSA